MLGAIPLRCIAQKLEARSLKFWQNGLFNSRVDKHESEVGTPLIGCFYKFNNIKFYGLAMIFNERINNLSIHDIDVNEHDAIVAYTRIGFRSESRLPVKHAMPAM